jgi:SAM-dependent methyltransferase
VAAWFKDSEGNLISMARFVGDQARRVSGAFRVDGDSYDDFMGRYSRRLAPLFAEFAGVRYGTRVLDVGAGTGALTAELVSRGATVAAADPSPEFVAVLRGRFPDLEVHEAPAEAMPLGTGEFDAALAQLVVAFVSDAPAAVAEMARVARRVAICMWGIAEVDMFAAINRVAAAIGASRATEPRRYRTAQEIQDLLAPHGEVESAELDVTAGYRDFDEFWQVMGRGVGPAGQWVASLDAGARQRAYDELFRQLDSPRGPFELRARAFAAAVTPA